MKRRGFTFIEVLVALFLLGVVIIGLVGLWSFGFNTTEHSQRIAVGYNIARREIERIHNMGFLFAPEGTQQVNYTALGQPATQADQYLATLVVFTLPDSSGNITINCLRQLEVTVTSQTTGETVFTTTTYLTRGGV